MPDAFEARLIVHRDPGGYHASWVETDGQESERFPLTLPLSDDDAADLRWYLEEYAQFVGAGTRVRAQGIEAKLEGWGRALFDAVLGGAAGTAGTYVYRNLVEAAEAGRPVQVTLGAVDPDVLGQPWEMMRDRRGPLAFQGVSIRRQLTGPKRLRRPKIKAPLRLLLIVSRPVDTGFIDPRNSIAPLLDGLDALPAGSVEVETCEPPTLARLEEVISAARKAKRPFHIVHFDGHGTYLPLTGVGALCFEKDDRTTDLVPGTRLGDLVARLDVPLVVLEACRTSSLSDRPVFGSVAPALLESGVGSVVAFSHAVHVEAARLLVERFYRELGAGLSVGQALDEARARLRATPDRWLHPGPQAPTVQLQDWFVPQLYQVGPDLALLAHRDGDDGMAPVLRARIEDRLHGFPPEPMYRFHGRARELLDLERAFRRHPAVVVSGMGGMGKTALAREAAAWWLRTGRFEQAVFCSFETQPSADRVVQLVGQALEGPEFSSHPAEEQQRRAVDLFRQRRVLLVWDNFESTLPTYQSEGREGPISAPLGFGDAERARLHDLHRKLVAGDPAGRLLVTCRPEETGLPGIKEAPLEGLARPDSLHLLAAIADVKGIDLERPGCGREAIDDLLQALADHPLSISLVAPHLKTLTPVEILKDFGGLLSRFADAGAWEGRNKSLLASLAFSASRLSEAARAVLPYLAWFRGGAFEVNILRFAELEPEAWAPIRQELVATALVRVEELEGFNVPFIRFHPTLPYAARAADVPDPEAAERRFLAVYLAVGREVDEALVGRAAGAGMALMVREEANFRAAIERAFRRGERQLGWGLADTLGTFLQRAARPRERDALFDWVRAQMPEGEPLDQVTWAAIGEQALTLVERGRAAEAVETLRRLIARLESEGLAGGGDARFALGTSYRNLGSIFVAASRPDLAVGPSLKAIEWLEQGTGTAARGNLAGALGDLANAYRALGRLEDALAVAERAFAIDLELDNTRNSAASQGRCAAILVAMRRYDEAEARYQDALRIASDAGDLALQGSLVQHQGGLVRRKGEHRRAVLLFQKALRLFQDAGDLEGEMQTCDLLGTSEMSLGHLEAAEAWLFRSRELSERLNDRRQLGVVAQNLGILYEKRAELTDDIEVRRAILRQAAASIEQSLALDLERNDELGAALSHAQLGKVYRLVGDLERAEGHALTALQIREPLSLPDLVWDYSSLSEIAEARGDGAAAAKWRAKRDAREAEIRQLQGGGGPGAADRAQFATFVLNLARAVYAARSTATPLPPDAAEALAALTQLPPPLGAAGTFLKAAAEGATPPPTLPPGLPPELAQILAGLTDALASQPTQPTPPA